MNHSYNASNSMPRKEYPVAFLEGSFGQDCDPNIFHLLLSYCQQLVLSILRQMASCRGSWHNSFAIPLFQTQLTDGLRVLSHRIYIGFLEMLAPPW